jgi:ribosomal protein S18 acetylase RimI-like enzyme
VTIKEVPYGSRESLLLILDQSFTGLYRWHAKRTLRSVRWLRVASKDSRPAGLAMLKMLTGRTGYAYYIAVSPSLRSAGIGGLLLDDSLATLRAAGAVQALACARADNAPSIRLLESRHFTGTGFGELSPSSFTDGKKRS